MTKLSEDQLRGRVVLSSDGFAVGEIERLFIDPADLRIHSIEVRLRKEAAERLGAHHSMFRSATVEIASEMVQSTGDVVILSVGIDALRPPAPPPEEASAAVH